MGAFTMRCLLNICVPAIVLAFCIPALAQKPAYDDIGRTPTQEEIRAWDIAVGPSGKDLPPGSGTAKEGAKLFAQKCMACHGHNGEGTKLAPRLVGGKDTITTPKPVV